MSSYSLSICVAFTIEYKIKPRIHFHCSMILPVYFVVMRAFVCFFAVHFFPFRTHACNGIFVWWRRNESQWHNKTARKHRTDFIWRCYRCCCCRALHWFPDAILRWAKNDSTGNIVYPPFWMSSSSPTSPFKYWLADCTAFGCLFLFHFFCFFCVALSIIFIPIRLLCRFFSRCTNGNRPTECDIAEGINIRSLVYRTANRFQSVQCTANTMNAKR